MALRENMLDLICILFAYFIGKSFVFASKIFHRQILCICLQKYFIGGSFVFASENILIADGVRSKLFGLLDLGIWTFGLLEFGPRPGRLKKFLLDLDFWTSGAREFGLLDFWTFGPRLGRLRKIYWTWTFGPGPGPLDLDLSTWTWACGPGRLGLRAYWARHKTYWGSDIRRVRRW